MLWHWYPASGIEAGGQRTHPAAHRNADGNAFERAHPWDSASHRNTPAHAYPVVSAHTYIHADPHDHTDPHRHRDPYSHVNTYRDADLYADPHAHRNTLANGYSDCSHRHTNAYTDAYVHPTTH